MVFERKVLRRIFGPTKERDGTWRIKTNDELDESTFKKRGSHIKDGRTATLQMLHFIYIFFNKYKY